MRLLTVGATGQVSGAERVLLRSMRAARDRGWQVACVCPAGPLADRARDAGVRVVEVPELGLAAGTRAVALPRTVARWTLAARRVRRSARGADVVLVNSLLALPAVRLARPAAPVAWLAHDVVTRPDRLRLYAACRDVLDRLIGVSDAVVDQLATLGPGPRASVVHNGVTWPVDPAPRRDADPSVVGLNAVLTGWKGQHVMLDAARLLPDGVRVELMGGELAGDEAYAAGVRARAAAPGLRDRVEVIGHLDDPLGRMRSWDVAVSASTEPEAGPLSVLEAMSIGVPVVASDHGGAPEVLHGTGLLVPPGDGAALAAAITRLLEDRDLRRRLGAAGRERVSTAHRAEDQQQRLLDVVADVARVGRRPGRTQLARES